MASLFIAGTGPVSGTYQVMLKITLTLTLTLTYTRPPMFARLLRRNNSQSVRFLVLVTFLRFFLFSRRLFFLKRWQSLERQAD